jgi:hypothetical protein
VSAAIGHIADRARFAVADQLAAKQRADTVRRDHGGAREGPPIRGRHRDPIAAILESGDHRLRHQLDAIVVPAGIEQNVMQIDAVNDDVRMLEARPERRPGRDTYQLLAGERVHHEKRHRRIRGGQHLLGDADAIEHVKDVGSELDAVADGAELRPALKHSRAPPAARQGERRREAAQPAADDQDRFARHG